MSRSGVHKQQLSPQKVGYCLRVGHIPDKIKDEEVKAVFSDYGDIVDYRRPVNLAKRRPSAFAFIRYRDEQSFIAAQAAMNGRQMWGVELLVGDGDKQDSFFTQDTGFITNEAFDVPKPPPDEFDASLPEAHYTMKHKIAIQQKDAFFAVRVDDLHPTITKEMLEELFSTVGEVASVYMPVDLQHACKTKGFAFVRFLREHEANRAVAELDGTYLGVGRSIVVTRSATKTYFNQDETPDF